MKRIVSIIGSVIVIAAVAAPSSAAQRPCADRALRAASELGSSGSDRYGTGFYVWQLCGKRTGIAFG